MRKTLLLIFTFLSVSVSAQVHITPKAFLATTASRAEISAGECSVVNMSFYVFDTNMVPIKFTRLAEQLYGILPSLYGTSTIFLNGNIENIVGYREAIKGDSVTRYEIIKGAFCPVVSGDINIPTLSLKMRHMSLPERKDSAEVEYRSEPLTIHVKSDPLIPIGNTRTITAGHFKLLKVLRAKEVSVGEVFEYQILIDGRGNTSELFPVKINREKFDVNLISSVAEDIVQDDSVYANKTIKFEIAPKKGTHGVHNMSDIFGPIEYYDLVTKSMVELKAEGSIMVTDKPVTTRLNKLPSDSIKTILFVVDISQSMMIEDFLPSRLAFIKTQMEKVIKKGYAIEPIVFAGFAKPIQTRKSFAQFKDIDFKMINKRGTAIGDAIAFAILYSKSSGRKYSNKMIIAGDGDNTGGVLPTSMAAEVAKANGFIVYSLGIGTTREAPFGTDANGKHHYVTNTFQENDFKMLAAKTGGKYFKLTPTTNLEILLKDILTKP